MELKLSHLKNSLIYLNLIPQISVEDRYQVMIIEYARLRIQELFKESLSKEVSIKHFELSEKTYIAMVQNLLKVLTEKYGDESIISARSISQLIIGHTITTL